MKKIVYILMFLAITISANAQWVQMSNGMGNNQTVRALTTNGLDIFAGTESFGVYISTNNGQNWTQTALNNRTISSLSINGNNIFAGTEGNGVYISTNNGQSWTQTILGDNFIRKLASGGNIVFAATNAGVYRTTNNGTNWTLAGLSSLWITALTVNENRIFAGHNGSGVHLSTNNGTNWTQTSLNNGDVSAIASQGNYVYAGTGGTGGSPNLFRSTDNGTTWTQISMFNKIVHSLAINGNFVFAGTNDGAYLSTDNGSNWSSINQGFSSTPIIKAFTIYGDYIHAGSVSQSVWRLDFSFPLPDPPQLLSPANNSTENLVNLDLVWRKVQFSSHYNIVLAIDPSFLNIIKDSTLADTSITISNLNTLTNYYWKVKANSYSQWGPFSPTFTFKTGSPWIPMYNGMNTGKIVKAYTTIGNNIFAGTQSNGVYKSTDNGLNWISVNNGLSNQNILSLTSYNNFLYAGTSLGGIYQSTNNGDYWVAVSNGLGNNAKVNTLLTKGTSIYAGTASGVFMTTNNGGLWTQSGLTWDTRILYLNGNTIYAGTYLGGLHISTDNGTSWMARNSGLGNMRVLSITVNGNNLFAGTEGGIFLSTNNGLNWTAGWLTNQTIYSLAASNNRIFIGSNIGSLVSFDNGLSWININFGFVSVTNVYSYLINNDHIFAGTNNSVWRHVLSEVIGISTISNHVPKTYSLSQNYPNPFNPSTKIKFDVLRSNIVTLKVFDVLGREIATLVNEQVKPGTYEVDWNASNYPSGVYFYTMRTEGYTETKRMILIK